MNAAQSAFSIAIAAALAGCAGDRTLAVLTDIDGHVLVSTGQEMSSATHPTRLAAGMRVLATRNSSAAVVFDDGRRVRILGGERYEVPGEMPPSWHEGATHRPMTPYHLTVSEDVLNKACARSPGTYVFACAVRIPAERLCLIYTRPRPAEWVMAHERRHCDGWDHGPAS